MFYVSSINKSYGKNKVLTDISLTVEPGQCIALLGINGSGKSTLLGILAGSIKPDSGSFGFDTPASTALLPQDNTFCGFSARTCLYRIFKLKEGCTPTECWEKMAENVAAEDKK